jgi:hypothetical protein
LTKSWHSPCFQTAPEKVSLLLLSPSLLQALTRLITHSGVSTCAGGHARTCPCRVFEVLQVSRRQKFEEISSIGLCIYLVVAGGFQHETRASFS